MTTMHDDDNDLERLLRSTLAARGDTVRSGPAWAAGDELAPAPRRTRARWVAPLAAAAAAAVVAAAIVANRQWDHDSSNAPSTQLPTSVRSPAPTSTTSRSAVVRSRVGCTTAAPPAWTAAVTTGTTSAGARSVVPLAVFPDGRVIVSRDFGSRRDVALVGADGTATSVYQVPSPNENQVRGAQVEGNTVLLQIVRAPRGSNGAGDPVERLVVLDDGFAQFPIATVTGLASGHPAHYIDGAALLYGHVYYDVRPNYDSDRGRIYDVDLGTYPSAPKVIFTGDVAAPRSYGGGVGWSPKGYRISVPRDVPGAVAQQTRTQPAVTDDTSWAWADDARGIGWYRAGQPAPVHIRIGGRLTVYGVAGTYVVYDRGDLTLRVLDVRTGASVALPGVSPTVNADAGVIAVAVRTAAAKDAPTRLLRLDISQLPEPTC